MPDRELDALRLLGILIAGSFVARSFPGPYAWAPTLAGILLLIVLFAFDSEGYRGMWQSIAFGATGGFCVMLASEAILNLTGVSPAGFVTGYVGATSHVADVPGTSIPRETSLYWPPLIWIGGAIILAIVDRARMSARAPRSIFSPYPTTAPKRQTVAPEPPVAAVPVERVCMTPEPDAAAVRAEPASIAPETVTVASDTVPATPPNAIPLPLGAGKPATVYLNLVGEGLSVMRPVGAEHLGKNYYRIVEAVPEGEAWEFQPGQIVRCEKRKLSTGKALVAVEEAPRVK